MLRHPESHIDKFKMQQKHKVVTFWGGYLVAMVKIPTFKLECLGLSPGSASDPRVNVSWLLPGELRPIVVGICGSE